MQFLQHLFAVIPDVTWAGYASLAIVMELVFRAIPTQKPLSWAHLIGDGLHVVGSGCTKVGDVLDKLLPQNVKP